jgi:DNA-nicking Smr family endonuclease
MAGRSLHPAEAALWARVMATVKPLRAVAASPHPLPSASAPCPPLPAAEGKGPPSPTVGRVRTSLATTRSKPEPGTTLDGGWDRRLARGAVQPDASLDLHGHTLASAHALLDQGLERAIARGDRVLLLVTGRPPRPESERPHARGAIRAAVEDWRQASRHASAIAAVRGAHPRHGGAGALYIILRRPR